MGGLATAGIIGGGYLAFKRGALKDVMHSAIAKAGSFRRGKAHAFNDAIRTWSQDEGLGELENGVKSLIRGKGSDAIQSGIKWYQSMKRFKEHVNNGMREHEDRMKEIGSSQLRDRDVQMKEWFAENKSMQDRLRQDTKDEKAVERVAHLYDDILLNKGDIQVKDQELKLKQTGFRYATVKDLILANEVSKNEDWVQELITLAKRKGKTEEYALNKVADESILTNAAVNASKEQMESAKFSDLRDFRESFEGMVHSLTTDFTIPLVKINPLRMFYVDHFFNDRKKNLFHISTSDTKNPIITGHNGSQGKAMAYADGKIYDLYHQNDKGEYEVKQLEGNYFLADAQKGPIARLVRNMSGISISKFDTPDANTPFLKRAKYHLGSFFDVGFQDEPGGQVDMFDPTSWGTGLINMVTGRARQTEYVKRQDYLTNAFGYDKDFIYMRKHKTLEESGSYKRWLDQFAAGRNKVDENGNVLNEGRGMQDVTLSTMFPYGFFERLNATLNQVNLGLSNKALGSSFDVFGNLLLKRIAPIWAGMELWDYLNYESENLLGFQFEDRFAQMYANTSVGLADLRDNLGVTDWAKGVAPLIVGGEQLADLPILGELIDWDDTAEEKQEYWEEGEVAVRKGRWWPLGNTPYTGAKIDRYEPNWVRRTLADVKFSESQYGSREEYFENSWMPTLRHPLAPIRHFFTDQYHWEEKHYQDRPYMVTGGIPEIENFPLIGPLLNSTIGQILKPQRMMHAEAWSGQLQEVGKGIPVMPGEGEVGVSFDSDGNVDFEASVPIVQQGAGYGGFVETQAAANEALYSYVTAGGGIQLLRGDEDADIYDALAVMDEKAPQSTGKFRRETMFQMGQSDDVDPLPTENPIAIHQALGNLHYNMSEMGGFYGFMGTSITGEMGDANPVIQSSSDITSYTRAFWDRDIGGFGGDANEIFRRFLPADRKLNEVNPINNTMPDWLPGSNYFTDFQTGDPYVKVKKGEMRLPGEGYERLYDIDSEDMMKMKVGGSFIGYDEEKIRDHILKNDAFKDEAFLQILDAGTDIHAQVENELIKKGVTIDTEQWVGDEKLNIGGFYDIYAEQEKLLDWALENAQTFKLYRNAPGGNGEEEFGGYYQEGIDVMAMEQAERDKLIAAMVAASPAVTGDLKTRGAKAFQRNDAHFENMQQVNFYASQKKTAINYIIEMDRQNLESPVKVYAFEYNPDLYKYSVDKVEGVRQGIRDDIESGKLNRGNLYDIIDRYRILADVAPYSQEFRDMKAQIGNAGLSEEEMEEVRTINEQVGQRKKKHRFYDYRFKTANVEDQIITVDHVIDNNTFIAVEHPDNPIRLAGVRVSTAKDNPVAQQAGDVISRAIRPGQKIRISYDADENNRVKDDTYKTIQAVVYDQKGRNLNKYLIDNELGKEKENDNSAAAIHARFTPNEIKFGAMWESFAHMDTMLHTKLLQVRSPLESYERREVYGKDWQEWTDPVEDFLIPAIQNSATHNPVLAVAGGGFIGMAFGSLKSSDIGGEKVMGRYGKIVGGFIGASVMGIAVLNKMVQEAVTGEAWIPERRKKERAAEEYFDVLEYVKYNALFEKYSQMAMRKEGVDVKDFIQENKLSGEERKSLRKDLEELKRRLYTARPNEMGKIFVELHKRFDIEAENQKEAMAAINKKLNDLQNHREIQEVSPLAGRALKYFQASKQTMYGYEAGDPISNILSALPKKDQEYLVPFINAPEQERERILDVVPNYMKRVLQSAWGQPVDEKMPLQTFFSQRPLPGANWKGWREDVSLDDVKVKFVDRVGLDPSEFDIWPDDQARADNLDVPVPDVMKGRETAQTYSTKLQEILKGFSVNRLSVDIIESNERGVHVDMDIEHNRRDDVQKLINQEGVNVL
jgi:hypothetical protein